MVIYEVNLNINNDIYQDYYKWLLEHVEQILKFDGFKKAEIGLIEHDGSDGQKRIRVSYVISAYHDLENYLTYHAPSMRADSIEKFGTQFSASRRIILESITLESR